jgi:hypothetical protein
MEQHLPLLFETITKEECKENLKSSRGKTVATTNKRLVQRAKMLAKRRTHSLVSARPGGGRVNFRLEHGCNTLSDADEEAQGTSGGQSEAAAHAAKLNNENRESQDAVSSFLPHRLLSI